MTKIALGKEYIDISCTTPSYPVLNHSINFGAMPSVILPSAPGYSKSSTYITVPETLYYIQVETTTSLRNVQITTYNISGNNKWTLMGNAPITSSISNTEHYMPFNGNRFYGIIPASRFDAFTFTSNSSGGGSKNIDIVIFPLKWFISLASGADLI